MRATERCQLHRHPLSRYDASQRNPLVVSDGLQINHFFAISSGQTYVDMPLLRDLANTRRCRLQDCRTAAHRLSKTQDGYAQTVRLAPRVVFKIAGLGQRSRETANGCLRQTGSLDEIAVAEQRRTWTKCSQQFQPTL